MWKKKKQHATPEDAANVEIFATHETGHVTLLLRYDDKARSDEAITLALLPNIAYNLAQRLTMAAMKIEEGWRE